MPYRGHGSRPRSSGASRRELGRSSHPVSPAGVQIRVDKEEYIDLRWAAAYWKAQPREAVEREADLKSDNKELRARIRELEGRLYGRRSERRVGEGKNPSRGQVRARPRGQQPGSRGHGRGRKVADLPEAQQSFFGRRIRLYSPGIVEIQSPVRSPNKAKLSTAPSGESTRNPPARWPAVSGINSKRSLTSRAPGSSVKSASPTK